MGGKGEGIESGFGGKDSSVDVMAEMVSDVKLVPFHQSGEKEPQNVGS